MKHVLLAAATAVLLVLLLSVSVRNRNGNRTEKLDALASEFLANYSNAALTQYFQSVLAAWNFQVNLSAENAEILNQRSLKDANFRLYWGNLAKELFGDKMNEMKEKDRRVVNWVQVLGTANLPEEKQIEYNEVTARMEQTFSSLNVTLSDGKSYDYYGLAEILLTSRDYDQSKEVWKKWFNTVGHPIKNDYADFVDLSNAAYEMDGFSDTGAYYRSFYETENFEEIIEGLWKELQPLYGQLHAYVRRGLYTHYGADYINLKGPIPSNILGNLWAQSWVNLFDLLEPYSGKPGVDATPNMLKQGYDPIRMFKVAEEFFTSIGLEAMTEEFWNNSMLSRPTDGRPVVCAPSAWNFFNGDDFRIKQCTQVNMKDLLTIYHEMGHVQYSQQYKNQPFYYRTGANPGLDEAVGDSLALSASTPKHLYRIGLLDSVEEDYEADINFLLKQALEKIAFLPFGYLIDKWRWAVFNGSTPIEKYQSSWDELRLTYQGIVPPMERSDAVDFDPGAIYHISANVPYVRYFVAIVLQFQFYEAMCDISGHTGPLYKCDFYRSTEVGEKMAAMLKLGISEKWPVALTQLTGSPDMTTSAIQRYFEPLTAWLKEQNEKNGDEPGWTKDWRPKGFYPE